MVWTAFGFGPIGFAASSVRARDLTGSGTRPRRKGRPRGTALFRSAFELGKPQAAAGTRLSAHWFQHSLSASTKRSMSPSLWTGDGVIRSRSVPRGTVG